MTEYILKTLNKRDALEIASRVISLDWEECEQALGMCPGEALLEAVNRSFPAFSLFNLEGEPIAALGVYQTDTIGTLGVWMMVTDAIRMSDMKYMIKNFVDGITRLGSFLDPAADTFVCSVWIGNKPHIKWLEKVGFVCKGVALPGFYKNTTFLEYAYVLTSGRARSR